MTKRKKKPLPKIGKKFVKTQFEYDVYKALRHELPRGASVEYEPEKLSYTITADYIPDFVINTKDGRKIYIEAKGNGRSFDHSVRRKMKSVKEQHPELDIRIVFYRDGKIGPKRKDGSFRKQSDWAVAEGFVFAIGEIPEGWFEE